MGLLDKILHKDKKDEKDKSAKDESDVKDANLPAGQAGKVVEKKTEVKAEKKEQPKKEVTKDKKAAPAKVDKVSKEDTKDAYKVLIKPLISEKAAELGKLNKYIFAVNERTNKQEIKKAINAVYGIVPTKVNIIKMQGKQVRFGRNSGKRKDWKKAIVTLQEGKSIEIYEGT